VGTLVERSSRYVMLLHLPEGRDARGVEQAMRHAIGTLPTQLRRSITGDQGEEMSHHARFTVATGIPVYFCEPPKPWQRGSNENTYWFRMIRAGLLRREPLRSGRWVTRRTRAARLSVDMSTAARRARALTGSALIEAC
jgi:transposase, IS30 family